MSAAIDSLSSNAHSHIENPASSEGTNWAEVSRQAREFLVTDHEDSWSPTWIRSFNSKVVFGR